MKKKDKILYILKYELFGSFIVTSESIEDILQNLSYITASENNHSQDIQISKIKCDEDTCSTYSEITFDDHKNKLNTEGWNKLIGDEYYKNMIEVDIVKYESDYEEDKIYVDDPAFYKEYDSKELLRKEIEDYYRELIS